MIENFENGYEWLSNFYPCEITIGRKIYPTVEHAYMSAKSNDKNWKMTCQNTNISAGKIKRMSNKIVVIDNWNEMKLSVMRGFLLQKFTKEPFKTLLLQTGDEYIQEGNTWKDKFWGFDIESNEGENNLGKIIMEIREQLKSKTTDFVRNFVTI